MHLNQPWLRIALVTTIFMLGTSDRLAAQSTSTNKIKTVSHHCSHCSNGCQACAPCAPGSSYSGPAQLPPIPYGSTLPSDGQAIGSTDVSPQDLPSQVDLSLPASSADNLPSLNQFSPVTSGNSASAAGYGLAAIGGYIEPATIASRFRVSWSDFKRSDAPDRAQYFYGYANSYNDQYNLNGVITDDLDYLNLVRNRDAVQGVGDVPDFRTPSFSEMRTYFEFASPSENASVFVDLPFRWMKGFEFGDGDDSGIGDLQVGFRLSLIRTNDFALTAMGKGFVPTGDASRGHGTGHGSIEYGLLFQKQLGKLQVFGQLTDWFSTEDTVTKVPTGTDFGGVTLANQNVDQGHLPGHANVLQYGIGIGYRLYNGCMLGRCTTITPVAEVVGWSVLDGKKSDLTRSFGPFVDADGDFIVNGKYGIRAATGKSSIYAGYGHNWTSEHWYREIVRVEYTRTF